jgi:ribosomal protein S18 acetylase RimI-like enzyme
VNAPILDTLVGAFLDDPLYRWLYPSPTVRPIALRDHLTFMLDLAADRGHIETNAHGRAVAVWTDPGVQLLDDPAPFLALLTRWAPTRVEAAEAGMAACAPHEPDNAAVLHLLATAPAERGRGHVTALIGPWLRELDADGRGAFLISSNPRNIPLYERCGFAQTSQVRVADGGPALFPMSRRPSATS